MIKTIKTVLYTLIVVFIFAFTFAIWHTYKESQANAKELEIEQVVETLEEITRWEKPDFERANNQTFINSVGQCVNYIYNTTTDGGSGTTDAVAVLDFGGDKTSTNGDFTIQFPAAAASTAIIRIA